MIAHEFYMEKALQEAQKCRATGDVPVGCVIVKDSKIIATGRNTREAEQTALGHAELSAIATACKVLNTWRLTGCTLYVTLEPCPMCAGAILNSRVDMVCFGAYDKKGGAVGGVLNIFEERFCHKPKVYGGILETECKSVLVDFFERLR